MARNFLKSSLQNASFNIVFQIMFRCVTFILNAFVLRYVGQAVLGVMNVRLLLLESTILFLSREAFRRACLSKTTEHNWAQVMNLLWLTVPLSQVLCVIFGYIWLHVLVVPGPEITQHYTLGVCAICISWVIEMFSEPLYLVSQAFLFVRFRVAMDTVLVVVRTVIFTPLIVYHPYQALVAFSFAHVLAACVYTIGHYLYFYYYIISLRKEYAEGTEVEADFPFESLLDFLPARIENGSNINYSLARLTWSFFKQGILKQVLTEGERYVMTLFSVLTFSEQGVYDVVNNLGSLAARFIFRPIEDSSYFYFSQMVGRDTSLQEQNQTHIAESANVLYRVLRCITSIGLMILVFGQAYSKLLLYLYGGDNLIAGPGPTLMQTHCLAVLLLAVNGITECFSFATMNTLQLDSYNYIMAMLSLLFLIFSWVLTRLFGGVDIILANCCNMAARIGHSVTFIKQRYEHTQYKPLSGLVPDPYFLATLIIAFFFTQFSESFFFESSKLLHLMVGIIFFVGVLASWTYEEHELVSLALQKWQSVDLMNRYQNLHKDIEHLKEWKKNFVDMHEAYLHTSAQLSFRRKQLISELNHIYPIIQGDNKHTVCSVHLPNSEEFAGHDEVMISIALGFVAHLVQMISIFLQLPLRYPVNHFGSRSKIVDHIAEKIPDKDRELEMHHRTMSGSSLDMQSSSQNASPIGSLQPTGGFRKQLPAGPVKQFEKGHRISKSLGYSELETKELGATGCLSYSLDKGLDEYEEIKKAEDSLRLPAASVAKQQSLSHVGSEPILTHNVQARGDHETASSGDEAQKCFLQNWQARGPAPICSDDDLEALHSSADTKHNENRMNGDCEIVKEQDNCELNNMIESSMVDSVLTRRTEALARRTGSFNLVRSRHGSFIDDAPS